jgi:HD-GYP domain-containing protein (c-di-GMP phosphodiesterase class II)/methylmalonyl-CoA mutase cobalamin-binding subunit
VFSVNGAMQASLLRQPADGGGPASERPGSRGVTRLMRRLAGSEQPGPVLTGDGPPPAGRGRQRLRSVPLALWVSLALIAAVGAIAAGASAPVVGCILVLALAATALGWSVSERGRTTLEAEIDTRTSELKRALSELEIAQAETVQRLSMAVEFRDEDTGSHIERIGRFSVLLAEHIGMDEQFCERLKHAAPLHDVGKVAIPDAILLKPGPLTPEERAIVETHAEEGHRLVRGSSSSILDMAATIALSHQEKWDGSGYPRGLKGESIPIEGRIVAVADVFDALTSDRVYRKAFSVEDAVQMMREQRGRHFDPVLLDAFMEVLGRTGPDAREQLGSDPSERVEHTFEVFATALERGDAEMAEQAIATAIEDGIPPTTLHADVIGPALRRIEVKPGGEGESGDAEQRARTITRRVLATLYRYMTSGTNATRERVLIAAIEDDRHDLGLQMVHDQLAAAGFHTIFEADMTPERLLAAVESEYPDVLVLGCIPDASAERVDAALAELRSSHPDLPVVLAGPAVGGELPRERAGATVLERLDASVEAVEGLLAAPAAASV